MRRVAKGLGLLAVIVVVNVVTVCVFLGSLPVGQAGVNEKEDCVAGDTNGDGNVGLPDVFRLLNFLFTEGPAPVACAEDSQLTEKELALLQDLAELIEIIDVEDPNDDTITYRTVRFKECNVQIVNGLGATNGNPESPAGVSTTDVNGLGNPIVGYNLPRGDASLRDELRTGSHNLVVGTHNDYSSFGGIVGGSFNTISGPWSSVSGGGLNVASGESSSVSGGLGNHATGDYSSVSGGVLNLASGEVSSVSGGRANDASGESSSVSGGRSNDASDVGSSVSGGRRNWASGAHSSVSGGRLNVASGEYSTVGGGGGEEVADGNEAEGNYSVVVGGTALTATDDDEYIDPDTP